MRELPDTLPAESFFLKTGSGERFCLYHGPHPDKECRGALIYVHPFGDEMNKSRRMAAIQARAFSAMGLGVLQIDLFGCGDSSGEFADARWNIWSQDLVLAKNWLENRVTAPISLWGLRLGALLALDFARNLENALDKIILWQPIISGESFLTQFLRLRLANEMISGGEGTQKASGTHAMRSTLASGETLEVAGYELAPDLAAAIDALKAAELIVTRSSVHWFEIVAEPDRPMTPAGARVVSAWKQDGVDLHVHLVPCLPFWATQEISECAELVSATTNVFADGAP
ncbi:exosortase A-associated hydrolase 2 [Nitrosospira sp. Nsp5]|uniref:Exosortase A system-associated hydrolase 2 n=1 Tax=Nitrosospira multiformis TaxID=1231 RepID=A0ABY0T634_9PROT|nr:MULTISPECIES: hydrolase 2, exosortase A system-associated [Nitrosospira]PTR09422.1 exosortase A-associated hydrolase 2 [Nitrosospira sp. Nsp5]SDQ30265.1 exosortase A system-associated hydrolase 2 [Nitrosospira multiformis]